MKEKGRWEVLNGSFYPMTIPALPGVYVVFCGKEVLYVGQTRNLKARIPCYRIEFDCMEMQWSTSWGTYKNFKIKVSTGGKYGSWAMRELRLIKKLKPKFNQHHDGARGHSING